MGTKGGKENMRRQGNRGGDLNGLQDRRGGKEDEQETR